MKRFALFALMACLLSCMLLGCGAEPEEEKEEETTKTTIDVAASLTEKEAKEFAMTCAGIYSESKMQNYRTEYKQDEKLGYEVFCIYFNVGRFEYEVVFRAENYGYLYFNKKAIQQE